MNSSGPDLVVLPLPALFTIQQEAVTWLLLDCEHASQYSTHVVIKSPDTDVFVLAVNVCKVGENLYSTQGKGITHALYMSKGQITTWKKKSIML